MSKDLFKNKYVSFSVGDIVQENWHFTYFENEVMTGIVLSVISNFYHYGFDKDTIAVHDKIKVYWISHGFTEELSGDMVHILSRVDNEEIQSG